MIGVWVLLWLSGITVFAYTPWARSMTVPPLYGDTEVKR